MAKKHAQTGAITILMSAIILFAISMISVYAARVGVIEHRVAANHYWAKKRDELAEYGLDSALAQFRAMSPNPLFYRGVVAADGDSDGNIVDQVITFKNSDGSTQSPLTIKDSSNAVIANVVAQYSTITTNDYNNINVNVFVTEVSTGFAQTFNQSSRFSSVYRYQPPVPIIAQGAVTLTPPMTVTNSGAPLESSNIDIWSGGAASFGALALDAWSNEASLAEPALTNDGFYSNFFYEDKATLKATALQIDCSTPCGTSTTGITNINTNTSNGYGRGGLVWVTGSLDLGGPITLGSAEYPIILVVEGTFTMSSASAEIYGVVYVANDAASTATNTAGDVNMPAGAGTIYGAIIAEGDFTATGLTINYETQDAATNYVINNTKNRIGSYSRTVAGSWRDF